MILHKACNSKYSYEENETISSENPRDDHLWNLRNTLINENPITANTFISINNLW